MKSISAFSNADGGTLIIGVDDDGNILGLEKDYRSLGGNKDEFESHLRNLLNKHFGKVNSISNLKVSFHAISDQEICEVQISAGNKPLYLEVIDDKDQKRKKFYVRSGNTSQELDISEAGEFVRDRF